MNYDEIKNQQNYAIEKIYEVKDLQEFNSNSIASLILKTKNFNKNFGILGENMYSFLKDIDIEHPDLNDVLDVFFSKNNNSYIIKDMIILRDFIEKNNISEYIFDILREKICNEKNNLFKEIKENVNSPLLNQQNIRLLKSPTDRKKVRQTKKFQNINHLDKELFSENVPIDFFSYIRNEKIYNKQIKDLLRKKIIFEKNNLKKISNKILKEIKIIKSNIKNDKNFGFNRISLVLAAKILSNMCSFNINQEGEIQKTNAGDSTISVFKLYNWHEVSKNSPKKIRELVNYLEKFPELKHKPLFDHYRVLVPFFKNNSDYSFKYIDQRGKKLDIMNTEESKKTFSLKLISKKETVGVLLGERNGSHYFISYFM